MIPVRWGIALLNLGSPGSPREVWTFLFRLFRDVQMFDFPGEALIRPVFAACVASLRADRVRRRYRVLGGTSPLGDLTRMQADRLEELLLGRGMDAAVEVCMQYSHPLPADAIERLLARGAEGLLGLPLYPQFSLSTTCSSLRAFRRAALRRCPALPYREVSHWHDLPGYQAAVARRILPWVERFGGAGDVALLFLAHSIPVRFVDKGDPYVGQVEETVTGILNTLSGGPGGGLPWFLAYQGQVGPVRWVGPPVRETLERILAEGFRSVIVVPVSFVSDHLETLYEIDLCYKREALELGFTRFVRVPSLNASDDFLEALGCRVEKALQAEVPGDTKAPECS